MMKGKLTQQCAYVGIYKPGELGRMTWRAVLLDTHRRGRGYRGKWESVVLSTPERKGIDNLVDKVERMVSDRHAPADFIDSPARRR